MSPAESPQPDLFAPALHGAGEPDADPAPGYAPWSGPTAGAGTGPADPAVPAATLPPQHRALADRLHRRWQGRLHLGTSSWHFPGWAGQVWAEACRRWPASRLSQAGLTAYGQHPLLRTVSLDRAFYRPLSIDEYRRLADQVPPDFRFIVKAPARLTDPVLREPGSGIAVGTNPDFLDPGLALSLALEPALQGLQQRLGVLVFQLSPLPPSCPHGAPAQAELLTRLQTLWKRLSDALPRPVESRGQDGPRLALELRQPEWLTPAMAQVLRQGSARYCVGLHDRMPDLDGQLPMLRALWPGDLVCRWNLQRGQRYAQARDRWAPFDRMVAPDPQTRQALARLLKATLDGGQRAFVTINNKAEGCAPASVLALAQALDALCQDGG